MRKERADRQQGATQAPAEEDPYASLNPLDQLTDSGMNQDTTLQREGLRPEAVSKGASFFGCLHSGRAGGADLSGSPLQTGCPFFRRPGSYDPLDAARRDAYREVFLYIRRQVQLAIKESQQEEKND